jgi:hypothetical protein
MRYFPLIDFQYIVLATFLGLIVLVLIYVAFGTYRRRSGGETKAGEANDIAPVQGSESSPVGPFLIIVYVGVALWAVAYLILVGIRGKAF